MSRWRLLKAGRAAALALSILLPMVWTAPSADAEEYSVTFRIKNGYPYRIQLAFYSQNRNAVWPGGGEAYVLQNSRVHEFALRCRPGERICYGGWVEGNARRYWGVGLGNKQHCSTCCYICSGNVTQVIELE